MSDEPLDQTIEALLRLADRTNGSPRNASGWSVLMERSELDALRAAISHLRIYASQRQKVTA